MRTSTYLIAGLLVFSVMSLVLVVGSALSTYNELTAKDESAASAFAEVQNQYKRRLDLLPNLANTVDRYAQHEKSTFEAVTQARAAASRPELKLTPEIMDDPQAIAKFNAMQGELSGVLSRLMVVQERYPELKANEQFLRLQDQLEGTENRVTIARRRYDEAVQDLNSTLRKWWPATVNSVSRIKKRNYFEAPAGAEDAPEIMKD